MKRADVYSFPSDEVRYFSSSPAETKSIAEHLINSFKPNTIIALQGDLGAGKTTFIKGLAKSLGIQEEEKITSPTFSYLHIYEGKMPLFHFDLYRLSSKEQFQTSGFQEYFYSDGIVCIEWPDTAIDFLPQDTLFIDIIHRGTQDREIIIRRKNV